jgi:hypothetical protein
MMESRQACYADIVAAVKKAAAGDMAGILDWTHEQVLPTDSETSKAFAKYCDLNSEL